MLTEFYTNATLLHIMTLPFKIIFKFLKRILYSYLNEFTKLKKHRHLQDGSAPAPFDGVDGGGFGGDS